MRTRRWDKAVIRNVADPTPWYPYPNNHDLQINIDRTGMWLYIGPSLKLKDPGGRFNLANIILFGGFIPNLFNGWDGRSRLKFKIQSKGNKSFQLDYLDVNGNLLGSSTHTFKV
jgi:hypothetical protein